MSLTRDQWIKLFVCANTIEKHTDGLISQTKKIAILRETRIIKNLVQEVIGQLEQK